MKVLLIHNKYGKFSGEEAVVDSLIRILKKNNNEVITYFRGSEEIHKMALGKPKAFFTGLYNHRSIEDIKKIIKIETPEVVHIHNLFPFIAPAVLKEIKKMGIPIVMTVHNYRLMCPNGLFYSKDTICEKCTAGLRELNCVTRNCENDILKSIGYSLRNYWARKKQYYLSNVDAFLCLTDFQKNKLASNGYPTDKIKVIPNFYEGALDGSNEKRDNGGYVAFAGRISKEKGIHLIFEVASKLPNIAFHLAGSRSPDLFEDQSIPENIIFRGMLNHSELKAFYRNARFLILTSVWYEGLPVVLLEAMAHKLPVIAPDMAGFPEIVKDNFNGLLFESNNSTSLASKIENLWDQPDLIKEFGSNGLLRIKEKYNPDYYYSELLKTYSDLVDDQKERIAKDTHISSKQKKVLFIHNKYGTYSGEEAVVDAQIELLQHNNCQVITYFRGSEEINNMAFGKSKAFFTGLYNKNAIDEIKKLIENESPDIVHIHNLFPIISPAVLPTIKSMGIPIVMTVHNYRLMCPNGLFYSKGEICEKCTSSAMELNCILKNCENDFFKSTGYAIRNYWARKNRYYNDNIDVFLCLTEFQKNKLVDNKYASNKIEVLPNFYKGKISKSNNKNKEEAYVAFVGRLSEEKGIHLLLQVAEKLPEISFHLAGEATKEFNSKSEIPNNVILRGLLDQAELKNFYENARFLVLPSICYEGLPMVLLEAMAHKLAIVAPNLGGFPEIAFHEVNALLFNPFDEKSLKNCIEILWKDKEKASKYAYNGHEMVLNKYNSNLYFKNLFSVYERLWNK